MTKSPPFRSYLADRILWLRRHPYHRAFLTTLWVLGNVIAVIRFIIRLLTIGQICKRRTVAQILAEAEAAAESSDYGEPGEREVHEEALRVMLPAFQEWLPYGPLNRFSPKLATKLQVVAHLRRHPSIASAPVSRPVFIISLPRAGSTLLHNLLALDEGARAMRAWELRRPLPPPTAGSFSSDPRVEQLAGEMRAGYALHPLIAAIHNVAADAPDECVQGYFPDYAFPTFSWGAEGMDAAFEWYTSSSMEGQFVDYKRVLQLLCSEVGAGCTHTVLKAPHHLFHLRTIAKVFPDAAFIWLHRRPRDVVRSCCLMNLHVHEYTSAAFEAPRAIGQRTLDRLAAAVRAASEAREELEQQPPVGAAARRATQFVDVYYDDLKADPTRVVEKIYDELGLEWRADPVGGAIAQHIAADEAARGAEARRLPPRQNLSLCEFGIGAGDVDTAFGDYLRRHLRVV